LSAHKLYGPKGAALLYIKKDTPIEPLITGGGQEYNKRSGTENVPAIVGLAESIKLAWEHRESACQKTKELKKELINSLKKQLSQIRINGSVEESAPHILNFSVPEITGDTLVIGLDQAGFAVATGSACQSRAAEASYVLKALGLSQRASLEGVRVSLGPTTTPKEIRAFVESLVETVAQLKRKTQK
jgi:cysteine desulfurase